MALDPEDTTQEEETVNESEVQDVTPPEVLQAARIRYVNYSSTNQSIMQTHETAITSSVSLNLTRQGEEFKAKGNEYFVAKDYHKALDLYTKAIGNIAIIPLQDM